MKGSLFSHSSCNKKGYQAWDHIVKQLIKKDLSFLIREILIDLKVSWGTYSSLVSLNLCVKDVFKYVRF